MAFVQVHGDGSRRSNGVELLFALVAMFGDEAIELIQDAVNVPKANEKIRSDFSNTNRFIHASPNENAKRNVP